jgi:hypothetical protein
MTDKASPPPPAPPPREFYDDVNNFIDMANRIEKRLDSHHAQLALMHAFSRYAAHHYCSTAKVDNVVQREAFASYVTKGVVQLVMENLNSMAGPVPAAANSKDRPV